MPRRRRRVAARDNDAFRVPAQHLKWFGRRGLFPSLCSAADSLSALQQRRCVQYEKQRHEERRDQQQRRANRYRNGEGRCSRRTDESADGTE